MQFEDARKRRNLVKRATGVLLAVVAIASSVAVGAAVSHGEDYSCQYVAICSHGLEKSATVDHEESYCSQAYLYKQDANSVDSSDLASESIEVYDESRVGATAMLAREHALREAATTLGVSRSSLIDIPWLAGLFAPSGVVQNYRFSTENGQLMVVVTYGGEHAVLHLYEGNPGGEPLQILNLSGSRYGHFEGLADGKFYSIVVQNMCYVYPVSFGIGTQLIVCENVGGPLVAEGLRSNAPICDGCTWC